MGSVDTSVNHRFCGADKCEADHTCTTPCPNGDECPPGENCYDDTPCSSNIAPPSYDFAYCGTSEADALSTCWQPCRNDEDCCFGQTCFSTSNACEAPNFSGSAHFFCGTGELSMTEMIFEIALLSVLHSPLFPLLDNDHFTDLCDASFRCSKPCPSGFDAECDVGERCFANTPCNANSDIRSYGLPVSAMNLAIQYIPPPQGPSSEAEHVVVSSTKTVTVLLLVLLLAS